MLDSNQGKRRVGQIFGVWSWMDKARFVGVAVTLFLFL